jgi:predicted nucleotidyltransferase component of viral defense system
MGKIKQIRVPFSVDIGIDDVIVPGSVIRSLKTQLSDFEEPKIYTYSLESTIAEKFDAILKRMEATSRMKDLFDIYYLSSMFDFGGHKLQASIRQTIQHRNTPCEIKSFERISEFRSNSFLMDQWRRYQPSIQMDLPDFTKIIDRLCKFIELVFAAINQDKDFIFHCSAEETVWKTDIL